MRIQGGTLYADLNGTTYIGDDGAVCYFQGVSFTTDCATGGKAAYQLDGIIHVTDDWANDGFDIYKFSHEYGHYLQQQQMGDAAYYAYVVGPSVWSAATDPSNHPNQWFEDAATVNGDIYYNQHVIVY
ncbi:hypothetical protein ACLOAU_11375 [Niabella sp. CJ426]|uniref:hypothetical protein n=1 Tax=Niabella sp. CJ426 TaxID=3393740 RepID=UPI003D08A7B4